MRGFNDADRQNAAFNSEARVIAHLKAKGICTHGSLQHNKCRDCGVQFDSFEDAVQAGQDALADYR